MSIEKIRTRVFLTSNLTVTGTETVTGTSNNAGGSLVLPYNASAAPTMATNGMINVAVVGGTTRLLIRSAGTTFTLNFGTLVSGGSITLTSA